LVLRVFDIVFAEGAESLLRVAVALLKMNRKAILELDFDELVMFLKDGVFDIYQGNESKLINDAASVKLTTRLLRRFKQEHEADITRRDRYAQQNEELKKHTRRLEQELKRLQHNISELNREHVDLANNLVQERVKCDELEEEKHQIAEYLAKEQAQNLELINTMQTQSRVTIDESEVRRLEQHINELNREHVDLANTLVQQKIKNAELYDRINEMETQLAEEKDRTADLTDFYTQEQAKNTELIAELSDLKRRTEEREKSLESQLSELNKEHVELVNQFVQEKVRNGELVERHNVLTMSLAQEQLRNAEMRSEHMKHMQEWQQSQGLTKLDYEREMQELREKLSQTTKKVGELESANQLLDIRTQELEMQVVDSRMALCEAEAEKMNLEQQYRRMRQGTVTSASSR
jgi:chromosome segregation ATPase